MINRGRIITRRVFYDLKKRFGAKADWYHFISATDDPATGTSAVVKEKYTIKRAIFLPVALAAEMNLVGGFRRVDTTVPGSQTSVQTRLIILDKGDLPRGVPISDDDYFVIQGGRFDVQKVTSLENDVGILVTTQFILGGELNQFFDQTVRESLTITETLTP